MVGLFKGGTKNGHHLIAHVLLERALLGEDMLGHLFKVFTQHTNHFVRRELLRIAGKPCQVAKEYSKDFFLPPQLQALRVFEHFFDHYGCYVMLKGPFDLFAFPLFGHIMINSENRIGDGKDQQGIDHIEPDIETNKKPAGDEDVQGEEPCGKE